MAGASLAFGGLGGGTLQVKETIMYLGVTDCDNTSKRIPYH